MYRQQWTRCYGGERVFALKNQRSLTQDTVLIVDDDPTNRFVLSELLLAEQFKVLRAANGFEAVQSACEHRPAVILMDISMPVMDGFEAARAIRRQIGDDPPQIFAVTAHVTPDIREKCAEQGFAGFFEKPIDIDVIINGIKPHLD